MKFNFISVSTKKILAISFSSLLLFSVGKLIFNNEADVASGFHGANTKLYANAISVFTVLIFIFLFRKNPLKFRFDGLYLISITYYLYCLFTVTYSKIPTLSIYGALLGIGYYVTAIFIGNSICKNANSILERNNLFVRYLLVFCFGSIAINAVFYILYFPEKSIIHNIANGISSDFIAAILLFIFYIKLKDRDSISDYFKFILTFIFGFFLNSFSSYIAFFSGVIGYHFLNKNYFLFLILAILITIFGIYLIFFLNENVDSDIILFDKSIGSFITGSGRFDLYDTAINIYKNEYTIIQKIVGVGFMAERSMLENRELTWITDPHNSIIINLLGNGFIGIVFYVTFAIYPFLFKSQQKDNSNHVQSWKVFHIISLVYGLTSSYYLGRPSFLLLFSLVFYHILKSNNRQQLKS